MTTTDSGTNGSSGGQKSTWTSEGGGRRRSGEPGLGDTGGVLYFISRTLPMKSPIKMPNKL